MSLISPSYPLIHKLILGNTHNILLLLFWTNCKLTKIFGIEVLIAFTLITVMTHFSQTHVTEQCYLRGHSSFLQVGLSVCALCCLLISEDLLTFHARQSTNFLGFCSSEKSLLLLHPSLKNGILNVAQAGLVLLGSSYLPPSSL